MFTKSLFIIFPVLSVLSVGYYSFNKFNSMSKAVMALQASNTRLLVEKKGLKRKISRLKLEQRKIKNKIKARRFESAKKKVLRIEQKIAKAPLTMLPWVGASVVVSTTAYEVNELCKEIESDQWFEKELFNEQKIHQVQNSQAKLENQLCSMDVETELQQILDKQLRDTKSWMGQSYDDFSQSSMEALSQYKEQFMQFYNELYEQNKVIYYAK